MDETTVDFVVVVEYFSYCLCENNASCFIIMCDKIITRESYDGVLC